jgi:hypothetical protein
MSRKSGELRLVREPAGTSGVVLFSGGAVVGATVGESSPRLGYMLLNAGKITEADLYRAGELHAEDPGQSWGDVFRSLGVVEPDELKKYLKFQVEEFVYEFLDWQDGHFLFGERPVGDDECLAWIPVESLLMEGARRADELSALGTPVESAEAVPRLSQGAASDGGLLDLTPEEWEVLGRVDGSSDLKAIAWTLGRSEFDVSKIVSTLSNKGLLEIGSHHEVARAKPPHELALDLAEELIERGELELASSKINSVLRAHEDEPRAHYMAARVLEREGDLRAAEQGYENALSFDPLAKEARQRLGLVRLKLGNIDGAARAWRAYLKMVPDTVERRRVQRALSAVRELQIVLSEFDGRERP